MRVQDSNNIEVDSDVSLEIPSHTVIAYSVLELEIKKDGRYSECNFNIAMSFSPLDPVMVSNLKYCAT